MDTAHMDNVPRRRTRTTGPSRPSGRGVRARRSGSSRVPARGSDAAADAVLGTVTPAEAAVAARPATRRGRLAGTRPSANRPASAPPNPAGRRVGRISASVRVGGPAAPVARSRLALNVAVLGLVLVAVAFILAVPLRNYFSQRDQLAAAVATEQAMTEQKTQLEQQKVALSDPDYLTNEAKRRLQFVQPGDTVYVVHAPALKKPAAAAPAKPTAQTPWYSGLWDTLSDPAAPAGQGAAPRLSTGRAGG